MRRLIELADQDYQYCLDYASGKTNTLALNNVNRLIKAIADGTSLDENKISYAIDTMQKYQKIKNIICKWADGLYDDEGYAHVEVLDLISDEVNGHGIKIDEVIQSLTAMKSVIGVNQLTINEAVETLRKYQKIEKIIDDWNNQKINNIICCLDIKEVLEDGNVD